MDEEDDNRDKDCVHLKSFLGSITIIRSGRVNVLSIYVIKTVCVIKLTIIKAF